MNEFLHRLSADDRVLLVGDTRQHQAVEAGTPYQQLHEAGMQTTRLDEIIRQRDPALKEAVEQLARGEVKEAAQSLDRQGRVHEIPDRETRLSTIAQEYARKPQGTLVISPDNESRRELNALIHEQMQQRGDVSPEEHRLRILDARQEMTGADRQWAMQYQQDDVIRYTRGSKLLGIDAGEYVRVEREEADTNQITIRQENGEHQTYDPRRLSGVAVYRESERTFSEGDRVQFTAPSKDLHVANREMGTINTINDAGEIQIRLDSGRNIAFNIREHPHLDHGYAVTSHSSQGQTAERVLIHVDTDKCELLVNSRFAYFSVSRAQHDAQIYTNNKGELGSRLGREISHNTAVQPDEGIAQKLGPETVQHTARDPAQGHGLEVGLS
jgi:ATP-dependent exoDNAse (exonuclease V) alpha subunit